jgi:hypothetical protein
MDRFLAKVRACDHYMSAYTVERQPEPELLPRRTYEQVMGALTRQRHGTRGLDEFAPRLQDETDTIIESALVAATDDSVS